MDTCSSFWTNRSVLQVEHFGSRGETKTTNHQ